MKFLNDIINYSDRYITDSQFPDKAIDLMDLACSHVKVQKVIKPDKIKRLEEQLVSSFVKQKNNFQEMDAAQMLLFKL